MTQTRATGATLLTNLTPTQTISEQNMSNSEPYKLNRKNRKYLDIL